MSGATERGGVLRRLLARLGLLPRRSAGGDPAEAAGWSEVRVAAHPDAFDRLLVDGVAPLVLSPAEAAAAARVVFLRDRAGDVHRLRVWIDTAAGGDAEVLAASLRAAAERNTLSAGIEVFPRTAPDVGGGPYGGARATRLFSSLLADAAPLLLEELAGIAAGRAKRTSVALDLMVAHMPAVDIARVFPDRYPFAKKNTEYPPAFAVYRAHADGLFVMSTDPAGARSQMDARYQAAAPAVRGRVKAVLAQISGGGPVVTEAGARWHDLARAYLLKAEEAVRVGGMSVRWDDGYLGDGNDLSVSLFHQIVQGAPLLRKFLRGDSGYLAARTMMSALYLALNGLGIRLVDRFFLCHAIARACEDLFQVQATSIIRGLSRVFARAPLALFRPRG